MVYICVYITVININICMVIMYRDASLTLDGLWAYPFHHGAQAILEISDKYSLSVISFKENL